MPPTEFQSLIYLSCGGLTCCRSASNSLRENFFGRKRNLSNYKASWEKRWQEALFNSASGALPIQTGNDYCWPTLRFPLLGY